MGRQSIEDVRHPADINNARYDVTSVVETRAAAIAETATRLKQAERLLSAPLPAFINRAELLSLIDALESSLAGEYVPSPACPLYMHDKRICILSEVNRLVHKAGPQNCTTLTVIPPKLIMNGGSLPKLDAIKMLGSFRTDLNRCGAGDAAGWMLAGVHGEHEPYNCLNRPHLHVVVSGEMVDVFDRLQHTPKYAPYLVPRETGRQVKRPVQVTRRQLTNLPYPLTYILKGFWPARYNGPVGDGKQFKRSNRGQRIPEPYHTEVLIWLHRHRLHDLTLMMGLSVSNGRMTTS